MGNLFSTRSLRPPATDMLNESVCELYSTQGVPDVEVVFCHGLQPSSNYKDAYWKTWLSRDNEVIWPKSWLGDYLRDQKQIQARILTLSYDSYARKYTGQMGLYKIVENMRNHLIEAGVGQSCPVVLIGHSLGGLVLKELLIESDLVTAGMTPTTPEAQKMVNFVRNCKGLFLYSTPHHGSEVADMVNRIPAIFARLNYPLVDLLRTLATKPARINSNFANVREVRGIKSRAIGENLPSTALWVLSWVVVPEGSSRLDVDAGEYHTAVDANHFDVCKPKSKTDSSFSRPVDLIAAVVEERRNAQARR
ncbi:unnamed protein product [Calypogeia fissa]